jgi:DNA polymerase-3 subunit gamma/tau
MTQPASQTPYRVLARHYRPQKLSELVGQDVLVKTLTQGIERNRLPHAFLLHGIRGVGKTTTARILAKALNCLGEDGQGGPTPNPCGVCESCIAIIQDRHLDVVEMDAASRTGVDDIREVIEAARYKAVKGRYKIYIIDEVHMLSKSAFNALLKTLEEPPPHVKFIFATTEIRKVPETVMSRCMRFDLNRLDPQVLFDHFQSIMAQEGVTIEEEALSLIVRAAGGSARDGLSLLDQAIALSTGPVAAQTVRDMLGLVDRGLIFALLSALLQGQVADALTQVRDLYHRGGDPVMMMEDLLGLVYWITCLKTAPQLQQDVTWPSRDRQQGAEIANRLSLPALMRCWQVLHKGYEEVSRSPCPSQAAEMVLVRIAYLSDLPHADDLLAAVQGIPRKAPSISLQEEKKSAVSCSLPSTFSSMMTLVQEAKEPILYSHLIQDIHLVSYAPGALTVRLADAAAKTLPTQLRDVLERVTGQPWIIEVLSQGGEPTLAQQKKTDHEVKVQITQDHPVVQSLKEAFPGATVTVK